MAQISCRLLHAVIFCDPYDYYGASGVIDCIDEFLFDKPLLLIGEDGANLINCSTPIAFIAQGQYWVNNHAHVLDGISLDFLRYIELHINAIDLKPFVTGTAQPKMNQAKMNSIPIAVPPLAEQRRIVGKVEQLLGLCDELASRQESRRAARERLVVATLDRLTSPSAAAESASHAQRLQDHFDLLFDTPTTIPHLRQAILQLAVQGQLVPQDPNDGPVTGCDSDVIRDSEKLPLLPTTWKYRRATEVIAEGTVISYGIVLPGPNQAEGVPYIRGQDIDDAGNIHVEQLWKTTSQIAAKHRRSELLEGDVLLCVIRHLRSAVVPKGLDGANLTQGTVRLRPSCEMFGPYLAWYFASPSAQRWMKTQYTGMSMPRINVAHARAIPIALPPLTEQKRIVSKVTELLSLCDALESQIQATESASTQLLSAAVLQLLSTDSREGAKPRRELPA